MVTLKPGYKTTEFLVWALANLGAILAAWPGDLAPRYAAVITAVSSGAYALSRGLAKLYPPKAVEPTTATPTPPPAT